MPLLGETLLAGPIKGVTLDVATARFSVHGSREVVFRRWNGWTLAEYLGPPVFFYPVDGAMSERVSKRQDSLRLYVLTAFLSALAGVVLFFPDWSIPSSAQPQYWNGLVAFAILAVICDSSFLPIPRITSANVRSSVAFIPLLASVVLFEHPWPMLMSGLAALVVDAFVRRKPMIRVWFNVAQYMLAVGVGGLVYRAAGGVNGLQGFQFGFLPFVALVITFFVINQGSVAFGVASIGQISVLESWSRIAGGSLLYDFISSSLAVLLAFLYIRLQLVGLAILILPLFFVRHMYQMNLQVERVNRELLELMVKAIEARDPYTSGHSVRVAEYARQIARELGLNPKHVDQIGIAALRGRVQMDIRNHHENYDGTGYPDGLTGDGIPIGARIIMIADTIDAMTTDRPYRKALGLQRALEELAKHSGRQFDPRLVELVSKSPGIRRLLGPQLVGDVPQIPSMNAPSRTARTGVRAAN